MFAGILAAGQGKRLHAGVPKALVRLGDSCLFEFVLRAIAGLSGCSQILMTPPSGFSPPPDITTVPSQGSWLADFFEIISAGAGSKNLLIINADAALITAETLESLLNDLAEIPGGLIWPVIELDCLWPEAQKTRLNFMPGSRNLIRGNAVLVRPRLLDLDLDLLARANRRPALAEVPLLGFWNCLKGLVDLLTIDDITRRFSQILGCQASIFRCRYPELGFDIDYPEDLKIAERLLQKKGTWTR